jgi:predicted ABC-type ATPase
MDEETTHAEPVKDELPRESDKVEFEVWLALRWLDQMQIQQERLKGTPVT